MKPFLRSVFNATVFASSLYLLPAYAQDSLLNSSPSKFPIIISSVLPVDDAFAMNVFIEAPGTVVLLWEIKEDFYLYRKSITVSDYHGSEVDIGELPEGTVHSDEFFGEVNIYTDRLMHRFPLSSLASENNKSVFTVHYQGCAEDVYCYPMQMKEIELTLPE